MEVAGSNEDGSFASRFEAWVEYTLRKVDEADWVKLEGSVPLFLFGLDLDDGTGACLDNGYGDDIAVFGEDLCHPELSSDDALQHGNNLILRCYLPKTNL